MGCWSAFGCTCLEPNTWPHVLVGFLVLSGNPKYQYLALLRDHLADYHTPSTSSCDMGDGYIEVGSSNMQSPVGPDCWPEPTIPTSEIWVMIIPRVWTLTIRYCSATFEPSSDSLGCAMKVLCVATQWTVPNTVHPLKLCECVRKGGHIGMP
jgi:hypothetical protein